MNKRKKKSVQYIVLENQSMMGPNIPEHADSIMGPFDTIEQAKQHITEEDEELFSVEGNEPLNSDLEEWGSRYTICKVVDTFQNIPRLSVSFCLKKVPRDYCPIMSSTASTA